MLPRIEKYRFNQIYALYEIIKLFKDFKTVKHKGGAVGMIIIRKHIEKM